ncbi:MAG: type IV toxin-antitoxin system AbiEi family antitoxin domain-containing protein [Prevotellaceae bacterium]|nr:type IV toxin-antitoxin system AbiEi family antitoxin domain-containing protein [Prevotellaceae bacterium]
MGANSSYEAMHNVVEQAEDGTIFTPDDFATYGTPDAIRSGLSRLCHNGKLHRFAKGIYYIPLYDKWDGSRREPSLDAIAQKIAQRDNARIIPTGTYALNRLGLSTQVPANIVYMTDGSPRQVKFGEGKSITFRHSSDMGNFAYQSKLMQLAVLAMREIGGKAISEAQLGKIKSMISEHVSEQEFNHDIVLAPTWVKTILQR